MARRERVRSWSTDGRQSLILNLVTWRGSFLVLIISAMLPEALTEVGKRLFPELRRFKNFYLVGGTALALQIGHRVSVDFDLFTKEKLPKQLLQTVKRVFRSSSIIVTYRVPEQMNVLIDGLKITFFQYEYPVIEPLVDYQGVSIASVPEIAAMKAFSIGKRFSYKDYVDWCFLLSEKHVTLPQVITLAERKFSHDFNDRLFLSQLASFEDVREAPIDFLRNPVEREAVTRFLEDAVRSFKL